MNSSPQLPSNDSLFQRFLYPLLQGDQIYNAATGNGENPSTVGEDLRKLEQLTQLLKQIKQKYQALLERNPGLEKDGSFKKKHEKHVEKLEKEIEDLGSQIAEKIEAQTENIETAVELNQDYINGVLLEPQAERTPGEVLAGVLPFFRDSQSPFQLPPGYA